MYFRKNILEFDHVKVSKYNNTIQLYLLFFFQSSEVLITENDT